VQSYFAARHKSLKIRIGILAVLNCLVAGYLTWIHLAITENDATAVVSIAGAEIQERLPEFQTAIADQLIAMAPGLIENAEGELLAMPARLREFGEDKLQSAADKRLADYRPQLQVLVSDAVDASFVTVDEKFPGLDPDARVERVLDMTIEQFEIDFTEFLNEATLAYRDDIDGLVAYLGELAAGKDLGVRQTIQRKLILATLALQARASEFERK
jgi:hypothetical protein